MRRQFARIAVLIAVMSLCVTQVPALAAEPQVVRIGYYRGDSAFQDGFADNSRKSGYAYEYYQHLAAIANWEYEYVYGSRAEMMDLLTRGEVDIVAGVYKSDKWDTQMYFSAQDMGLGEEDRFFAISLERHDLLVQLDTAHSFLLQDMPDLHVSLSQKYYGGNTVWQMLTDAEKTWLHEKGTLRFGYVRGNLPLSDQNASGEPIGFVSDLVADISGFIKMPIETVCYDDIYAMQAALANSELDAIFPFYADLWVTENKGFLQTDIILSDRAMILYKGDYDKNMLERIAVSRINVGQPAYLSVHYPESDTIMYETRTAALQAVLDGEAGCMIGCSSVLQYALSADRRFQDMHIGYLNTSEDFSIAVARGDNILLGILNKAIRQLDNGEVTNAIVRHANTASTYTLRDFIEHNAISVVALLMAFFGILLLMFISYRRNMTAFNKEQAITRAALEDALAAAKVASEAKSTFLSSMSHDIRTPLNGILGMTTIAAAHIGEQGRVQDCLGKITAAGKHLLALINEVLDMSKIESGNIYLDEELFSLSSLIDDLVMLNRPLALAKHQDMEVHVSGIRHEEVLGDSVRIQQVFTNLVSNAVKYTPDGGRIEIMLTEKPSGSPVLGCYEFRVKDNGIGMSEDYLPKIFEPFSRANEAASNQTQGTGLGMSIARNLIRMMNGDITVQSKLGEGSTFTATVFLKLKDDGSVSYDDLVDLSVLVVDDDQVICESASLTLSELGMNSEWVLSGREAVERIDARHAEKNQFFAVLLDWKMPDMDGLETTRAIRQRVGSDVPIIIISAYDWSSIETEARAAGVDGFVGKPLFPSRLAHLFGQLLGRENAETIASASGPKEILRHTDFTGKYALLAEDNELNAEIAIEILGMMGLSADWVKDGREAVDRFSESEPGHYDCIFMDVQMPNMDGLTAARTIRAMEHPDAGTIPILAMTANAFAEDVQAVLNAGMNEHITKPLNLDKLVDILNQYLAD